MLGSEDPRNGQSGWDAGQAGSGLDRRSPGRRPPRVRRPPLIPPVLHARPTRGCVPEGAWPGCSPGSKELNANRAQPRPGQAAQPEPGGEAEQQPPARRRPGAPPPPPGPGPGPVQSGEPRRSVGPSSPARRGRAQDLRQVLRPPGGRGSPGTRDRTGPAPMASAACPGPGDLAM